MPFVTLKVQIKKDEPTTPDQQRRYTEQLAKAIAKWNKVYAVEVKDEPEYRTRRPDSEDKEINP